MKNLNLNLSGLQRIDLVGRGVDIYHEPYLGDTQENLASGLPVICMDGIEISQKDKWSRRNEAFYAPVLLRYLNGQKELDIVPICPELPTKETLFGWRSLYGDFNSVKEHFKINGENTLSLENLPYTEIPNKILEEIVREYSPLINPNNYSSPTKPTLEDIPELCSIEAGIYDVSGKNFSTIEISKRNSELFGVRIPKRKDFYQKEILILTTGLNQKTIGLLRENLLIRGKSNVKEYGIESGIITLPSNAYQTRYLDKILKLILDKKTQRK